MKAKSVSSKNRSRGKHRNHKSGKRIDGLNTMTAQQTEISVSLRNISDLLSQWEQSGFKTDGPIARQGNTDQNDSDPASVMLNDNKKEDYASMNSKDLGSLLDKRRQDILRSNRSMDGFDRDAERKFMLTLTREQKRSYNEFLRDYQQKGYTGEQAVRNAVLKVHTKIQMENQMPPDKEMIRMLKALDKDEERSLEKKGPEFKLERGKVERD